MTITKQNAVRDNKWLDTRRGDAPCAVPDCNQGPTMAAHIHFGGDSGTGRKVSDVYTVPLCAKHHKMLDGTLEEAHQVANDIIRGFCEMEYHAYVARQTETD